MCVYLYINKQLFSVAFTLKSSIFNKNKARAPLSVKRFIYLLSYNQNNNTLLTLHE